MHSFLASTTLLFAMALVSVSGISSANPYEQLLTPPYPSSSSPTFPEAKRPAQDPQPYPSTSYPSTAAASYPSTSTPYPTTATPEETPLVLGSPTLAEPTMAEAIPAPASDDNRDSQPVDLEVAVEEEPRWYYPSYWIQLPGWDTALELGINGSSGTSESLSVRTGGYIKRESKQRKVNFDIYHNRTKAGGIETQNNAQMKFRHEWLLPESAWTVYAQTQLYYDEFQAFDLSLNLNGGLGYRLVDEDWMELTARFGAGSVREFGSPGDEWVPEAQFGVDYEQKLSETQKLTATMDYYPEWEEFGRYRMLSELGWEVELAVPSNVSLKVAATNRHDSDPQGADPNNFNYSVLLLWKL